jgi:tRNA A-37 threonylcarbamoyl transferase component Bud32
MDIKKKNEYLREPNSLMKLNHANIVKYKTHFLFPFNKQKYLILIEEFVEGGTLQDTISLLREQDPPTKINFIIKTLEALSHFKSTLNLHGDLTFTNIIVRENFQPVVIDPGFSEQRFKSPDQIINDEKIFIVDLLIKLLTPLEKNSIDLDSLMKFDSLSEFLTFFKSAEKKINTYQKLNKIQLERNRIFTDDQFFQKVIDSDVEDWRISSEESDVEVTLMLRNNISVTAKLIPEGSEPITECYPPWEEMYNKIDRSVHGNNDKISKYIFTLYHNGQIVEEFRIISHDFGHRPLIVHPPFIKGHYSELEMAIIRIANINHSSIYSASNYAQRIEDYINGSDFQKWW